MLQVQGIQYNKMNEYSIYFCTDYSQLTTVPNNMFYGDFSENKHDSIHMF